MPSEQDALTYVGRNTISYDVLREGWTRQSLFFFLCLCYSTFKDGYYE